MKSIKPGRGPSGMSFIGSIVSIIFGVFWTMMAVNITAKSPFGMVGVIFPLFGVLFIILGIIQAVYNYKNATGKDRYSIYDITDSHEEDDPSDKWIKGEAIYCPYCGAKLERDYIYCPKCGKGIK
jgi:DNA-directed RNA polymerase subunit RPC12/RpoP/lipopolysaccharide export LptBFGC system permease protein LptF